MSNAGAALELLFRWGLMLARVLDHRAGPAASPAWVGVAARVALAAPDLVAVAGYGCCPFAALGPEAFAPIWAAHPSGREIHRTCCVHQGRTVCRVPLPDHQSAYLQCRWDIHFYQDVPFSIFWEMQPWSRPA